MAFNVKIDYIIIFKNSTYYKNITKNNTYTKSISKYTLSKRDRQCDSPTLIVSISSKNSSKNQYFRNKLKFSIDTNIIHYFIHYIYLYMQKSSETLTIYSVAFVFSKAHFSC